MRTKGNEGFQENPNKFCQEFNESREIELLQTSNSVSTFSYYGILVISNIKHNEIISILPELINLWYPIICARIFRGTNDKSCLSIEEEDRVPRTLYEKWLKDPEKKEKFGKKIMNALEYIFKHYFITKSPNPSIKEYAYIMNVEHPIYFEGSIDSIDCFIYNIYEDYHTSITIFPNVNFDNRWMDDILNNAEIQQWIKLIIFLSKIKKPNLKNREISGRINIKIQEKSMFNGYRRLNINNIGLTEFELNELSNLNQHLKTKIKIYGVFYYQSEITWFNRRLLSYGNVDDHEIMIKSPSMILQQNPDLMNPQSNIQQLYLDNLKLKDITIDFSKMPELKILNLSSNPISKFPMGIEKLKNLLIVDLSKTNIEEFPTSDFKMESNPFIFFKQKFYSNNPFFNKLAKAEINMLRKSVKLLYKDDYYSEISLDNKLQILFKDKFDKISQLSNTRTGLKFKKLVNKSKKQNSLDKFF